MNSHKKHNLLFVEDYKSPFNTTTEHLEKFFDKVDKVTYHDEALHLFTTNSYDIVVYDISMSPEKVKLIKQLQDIKSMQSIFVLLQESSEDHAFGLSQLGVNVVLLTPEQLDEALENIALFNPETGAVS